MFGVTLHPYEWELGRRHPSLEHVVLSALALEKKEPNKGAKGASVGKRKNPTKENKKEALEAGRGNEQASLLNEKPLAPPQCPHHPFQLLMTL